MRSNSARPQQEPHKRPSATPRDATTDPRSEVRDEAAAAAAVGAGMADIVQRRRPQLRDMEAFMVEDAEAADKVMSHDVRWDDYAESNLITREELGLMKDLVQSDADGRGELVDDQPAAYVALFSKCLSDIAAEATVKYVLALVDQVLDGPEGRARAAHFHAFAAGGGAPYAPLLGILRRHAYAHHEFTVSRACGVLAVLLSWREVPEESPELVDFFSWCTARMDTAKGTELIVVLGGLKTALRSPAAQLAFVRHCGGYRSLAAVLRRDQLNSQVAYVSVFCLWLLTFHEGLLRELHDGDVVSRIVDVLRGSPREKVVRVCFATLANLLDRDGFNEAMAVSELPRLLPTLLQRKLEDSELREAIARVDETLQSFTRQLSSFDKYVAELETGSLHWSPVHNEKFWRQNVQSFEVNQFDYVKKLLALLHSDEDLTLEVACYDVGEFARFHPDGRRMVDKAGAKKRLMDLLSHGNPKVAKMALLTVQKLMVQHWESLAAFSSSAK